MKFSLSLMRKDISLQDLMGSTEELSQDKFSLNSGGNELTINGLGSNTTGRLIATLKGNQM